MEEEDFERVPFVQVPEQMIRASAELLKDDANNAFLKILEAAAEFKKAGMTPVYLYDTSTMNVSLVTLETFGRKLH